MFKSIKSSERYLFFKRFWVFTKPLIKKLYALGFLKLYKMLLTLITPVFYKLLIDNVLIQGQLKLLPYILLAYLGVYALQSLGVVLDTRYNQGFYMPFTLQIRKALFKKYLQLDSLHYESFGVGDLNTRLTDDVSKSRDFIFEHIIEFLFSLANITVIGLIMLVLNPWLSLFGFCMVPLSFLFTKVMGKKAKAVGAAYREEWSRYQSFLHGSFQNWKEIKANGLEDSEEAVFSSYWDRLSPLFIKRQVLWFINRGFIEFKNMFITKMNLYFLGGLLIIQGHLTVGSLLIFMNYYEQFFGHISKLSELHMGLKNDVPSYEKLFQILDTETPPKESVKNLEGEIRVEGLHFQYPSAEAPILQNLSFSIRKGERVALVGKSGCGKSTLAKLLAGAYTPTKGDIYLGGRNLKELSAASINRVLSCVMQEPILFNLSIRENLLIIKKDATEEDLIRVCERADIYTFIRSLPQGFDSVIGERGVKLSGGQKQRLAIARVLLLNPPVILFDEATSSLDNENEKAIVESIDRLSKDKTIIIIAHRPSTIKNCDRIIKIAKED